MQVKVCGITNVEDAIMVAELGVNYLGYIINYTSSPRYISPTKAAHIIRKTRNAFPLVRHVAVVVDPSAIDSQNFIDELDADIIQFHGSESPDYIQSLSYVKKWKTIEIAKPEDMRLIAELISQYESVVDGILLDSGKGSGQLIPAELLSSLKIQSTFILAGGITPENILERLQLCSPDIIDINSGVEIEPGKKDREKIIACLNIIRSI